MVNILRGSRVKKSSDRANRFTSSIEFDAPIARHVVRINMAHMLSLLQGGEVNREVAGSCLGFLASLPQEMKLDSSTEDVHHMIEQEAIRKIGMEKAGYLNLGKSRNDQVSAAVRMEARERVLRLCEAIVSVQTSLQRLSGLYGERVVPGYTHLQQAQPVTVSFHLQSYFDCFERDFDRFSEAFPRVNLSPMGAAALAGTSIRVRRRYVASLLGFEGLISNAMDAVSSRDFAAEVAALCEITMINLSRLSEEIILWSSREFGLLEVSDEHAATSSIMPQKKNPVVAETIRAKCGSVLGNLTAICSILKALPNSYNLDLQEVTPRLWEALSSAAESMELMAEMLPRMKFIEASESRLDDKSSATELANYLVRRHAVPFREAHSIVGQLVRESQDSEAPFIRTVVEATPRLSSRILGRELSLGEAEVRRVLDPAKGMALIRTEGGANPLYSRGLSSRNSATLKRNGAWIAARRSSLGRAEQTLQRETRKATKGVRS